MMPEKSSQYVCPTSKALPKGSKGYVVHMTLGQYSLLAQLSGGISSMSSHQQHSTRTLCTSSITVLVKHTKVRLGTSGCVMVSQLD